MSDFADALRAKIAELERDKERVESKIEALAELLSEEEGRDSSKSKRRGRPRTRKKKEVEAENDPEAVEANSLRKTDPEVAERLANREFMPVPRPPRSFGPGIKAGRPEDVKKGKTTVTGVGRRQLTTTDPEEEPEEDLENGTVHGQ